MVNTMQAVRRGPGAGPRLLLCGLGALGVLLGGRLAWAEDEPKLAGVEVPAPKRTRFVPPEYPPEAKALGQRGIVILSLVIGIDGKVVSGEVVRSIPAFDEAALAAAKQWEYEVTRVQGKPVAVRLSVPITFALRLPEVTRGPEVPELREGLTPNRPAGVADKATATVVATLDVEPSGQVVAIAVEKGDWPWFESATAALRTWVFVAGSIDAVTRYQVTVRFLPARKAEARVDLQIERSPKPPAAIATAATEPPTMMAPPAIDAAVLVAPVAEPIPSPQPPGLAEPAPPAPNVVVAPSPTMGMPPGAPAPAPVPSPPPPSISAVRDVTLGEGVPDLASGRRPVVPPLARLGDVSGAVEVRFTVDAGGATAGLEVSGPELLQEAARQTVASWSFRRTTAERLFLVARLEYQGIQASASVKRAE